MINHNAPPSAPVDTSFQCGTVGCGTLLLKDGTCPRCNPPARRPTAEKLQLARAYGDKDLQALAHAEIQAGIATGMGGDDEPVAADAFFARGGGRGPTAPQRPTRPVPTQEEEIDAEVKARVEKALREREIEARVSEELARADRKQQP